MALQLWKDIRRAAAATAYRYPDVKVKAKDATNTDPWGPTDQQKLELAHACLHPEDRAIVMKALWKRCSEGREFWIQVIKALDVFEFFLLVDNADLERDIRMAEGHFAALLDYNAAKNEDLKKQEESNEKVRAKARKVMLLLHDPEHLVEERDKLRRIQARLAGEAGSFGAANVNEHLRSVSPQRSPSTTPRARSPPSIVPLSSILGAVSNDGSSESSASPASGFAMPTSAAAKNGTSAARRSESPVLSTVHAEQPKRSTSPLIMQRSDTDVPRLVPLKQPANVAPPPAPDFLDFEAQKPITPIAATQEQLGDTQPHFNRTQPSKAKNNNDFDPFVEASKPPQPDPNKTVLKDFIGGSGSPSTPPANSGAQQSPGRSSANTSPGASSIHTNTNQSPTTTQPSSYDKMMGLLDTKPRQKSQETLEERTKQAQQGNKR